MKFPEKLRVLSFTAEGVLVPYSLQDVHKSLWECGHTVLVQDIASMPCYHDKMVAIVDAVVSHEPDLIFTIDQIGMVPAAFSLLEKPDRIIAWFFDDPFRFTNDNFLLVNSRFHFFLWDRAYIPRLKEQGYANVEYQPFATNPEVFHPVPGPHGEYDYDVSFVGICSEARMETIRLLAEAGIRVDVFGDEKWKELSHPNVIFHGRASNREDCPEIFSRSKINLNITSEQLLTAVPLRIFDVLACGGFLLTDRREDTDRLFSPGRELVVYEEPADLPAVIREYLDKPAEREKIGRTGRDRVLKDYTFSRIVPNLLERTWATPPPGDVDSRLEPTRLVRTMWFAGLSLMKFENYKKAYEMFINVLKMCPEDHDALLALVVLANRTGQLETARSSLATLESWNSRHVDLARQIARDTESGTYTDCWKYLYRILFPDAELNLQPDGTISGWRPSVYTR